MPAFLARIPAAPRDHAACSGCSLCLLVCPVWRQHRDPRRTPEYLLKALQCGASAEELAGIVEACPLCGACVPVCPERVDLVGLIADLRRSAAAPMSHGAALSRNAALRRKLRATDLYVIEPRAYHADYERLVKYYDQLQVETGCSFNLDLQRIAIPAQGQVAWILRGRQATRVVCESRDDCAVFAAACDLPVVHITELVEA
ncbi:MAG: 4Fe-4S dicluster domain-containing protein [Sulfuritalea sp.]|jgi:ferredoxin|nr:4Fe-4S dicluster domain-containing protein [Sulfuritalea sp.]